jgi:hypothetical protein
MGCPRVGASGEHKELLLGHRPDSRARLLNRRTQGSRLINTAILLLISLAVCTTIFAVYGFFLFPEKTDLLARYREGEAWLRGTALYQQIPSKNMFPPWVTVVVFAPMARISFTKVQVLVLALNVAGLLLSVRGIARALGLASQQTVVMTALLLLLHGMFQSWVLGQFTGLMLYPVTMSWIALREQRYISAGAWLAPIIATKPTFIVLALLLPAKAWITSGVCSLLLTLVGVALTGWDVWLVWLHAGGTSVSLPFAFNASFWGIAARWQYPHQTEVALQDLHVAAIAAVLLVIAVLARFVLSQHDPDRRFFFAGMLNNLASPLGWIYYLPLMVGPAMATRPGLAVTLLSCALLMSPMIGQLHGAGPVVGSMYFVGSLAVWITWSVTIPSRRDAQPLASQPLDRSGRAFES